METKRRRLLLADDSLTIQKVVTLTFSDEEMDVVAVGSGDEAVRRLEESGPYDIVLADVHMPGLNGYEVCERVKQDARWRHLPVVLLAGAFEPFNEAEARRVGADEVLSKPFKSIRGLIDRVGSLLGSKGEEPAPHEETRAVRPHAPVATAAEHAPARAQEVPVAEFARPDSFADLSADDEMIEATPAEQFEARAEAPAAVDVEHVDAGAGVGAFAPAVEEAGDFYGVKADEWAGGRREEPAYAVASRESVVEAHAPRGAYAARAASAGVAADEALLDIGSVELPAADADDFVLDLDFDEPAPSAPSARPDAAGAFAEAAHGEAAPHAHQGFDAWHAPQVTEPEEPSVAGPAQAEEMQAEEMRVGEAPVGEARAEVGEWAVAEEPAVAEEGSAPRGFIEPQVVASDEPVSMGEDLSVEGDVARPPAVAAAEVFAPASETHAQAPAAAAAVSPESLSPEMIDAIARRVVELMSERVVQEVAWEVVPDLAERLIRQRLDQQK